MMRATTTRQCTELPPDETFCSQFGDTLCPSRRSLTRIIIGRVIGLTQGSDLG
jgi:hypothetical protein